METARHVVALITIVLFPPSLTYWLIVHPLTGLWRKIGLRTSYAIFFTIFVCLAVGIYRLKSIILRFDFGTNWLFIGSAILLFGVGIGIEVQCRRYLSCGTLVGVPQLMPEDSKGILLKDGIYGRIRHPRYAGATLGLLSLALFANYLAPYVLFAIWFPALYLITFLEERELIDRFGDEYLEYQKSVPRFIPRRLPGKSEKA